MDESKDFLALQDDVQEALIATTRTTGRVAAEDIDFQRSLDPAVAQALDGQSTRILSLSYALLQSAATLSSGTLPILKEVDDVDNNWRGVVDVLDTLLEKTDICLDEYTGVRKRKISEQVTPAKPQNPRALGNSFRTQNLVKPQNAFEKKPNNTNSDSPWRPLLTMKPHAVLPLADSFGTFTNEFDKIQYKHPYETEILEAKYPDTVFKRADPIPYLPVETTAATFVDTFDGVLEMLKELKDAVEIAIDLEHHDTRTYVGLVSLMQISTRRKDWVVDTLKPWRQQLQVLNEVFADPAIIKVFHGAFMDVVWLQRDLGLYVVGLFDTYWASRALGYAGHSLAFLLKKFINLDADKKYQLADWRIRPLPDEMFYYARADTHYLLYIYDNMRNQLLDRNTTLMPADNKLENTLQHSREVSLLRYEPQFYDAESGKGPGGWLNHVSKSPSLFNEEQFAVFRVVHAWRDAIARADDESPAFVMPPRLLNNVAKLMPKDLIALHSVCHPMSQSVKSRSGELLALIKRAMEDGKTGPSTMDYLRPNTAGAVTKIDLLNAGKISSVEAAILPVDEASIRTERSTFWGRAFGSSIWDPSTPFHDRENLRLAIPLPPLSSDTFRESHSTITKSQILPSDSPSRQIPLHISQKESEETFTLKPGGRSQQIKHDPSPEGGKSTVETFAMTFDAETVRLARRAKRKSNKIRKRAENRGIKEAKAMAPRDMEGVENGTLTEGGELDVVHGGDADEVFDYSKAASVLHPKRKEKSQGGSERKKPFDPYAKSGEGLKGMRRAQTERPGKTFTFKN